MASHVLNVEIAERLGVDAAILINNFAFWQKKNQVNQLNFHDGRTWTYNSAAAFTKLFPYWNQRKIYRIINKLEEDGILVSGNFNEHKWDRTKWYSIADKSICHEYSLHLPPVSNAVTENVEPIPDINTDSKPDVNTDQECAETLNLFPDDPPPKPDASFTAFWDVYPVKKGKSNAEKKWVSKKLDKIADIIIADVKARISREWDMSRKQYIPHPTTYLNGERWKDEIIDRPLGSAPSNILDQSQADYAGQARKYGPHTIREQILGRNGGQA